MVVCLQGMQGAGAAPVSVAMGIDLGTDNSVVALARKRGVDIVANEASQRSTPSIVSFGHDQRYVGEAGQSQRMMNLKNTVAEPKRLLAKHFSDPVFMEELKTEAYEVVESEGGEISVKVSLCGSERAFRPVQIIAMLLANLKKIAEADHNAEVVDVAISVPVFFTEHQRRAIHVAAKIAGLTCLRLINDNTATALAYGITKTDLPEKDAKHVAFVDCGRDCMQVSIVAFTKGQLKVLSHTYTKNIGGQRIDSMLFDHFADEFKEKFKIDARTQDRARLRLLLQCEKIKKTLSACPADLDTPINVECLMNDMDVSGLLNRLQLEELLEKHKVFGDLAATCDEALSLAGITKDQLETIEIVGGTSRIPALREHLSSFFGKECQTTINAAESVARGASLACAMDSPAFKVREFKVVDWNMFPIDVAYKSDDASSSGTISLKKGAEIPGTETIKIEGESAVSLDWSYTEEADLAPDVPRAVASHKLKVTPRKGKQTIIAKVGFDNSGCVSTETTMETQVEEAVAPPKSKAKPPPAPAAASGKEGKAGEAGGEEGKEGDAEMGEAKVEGEGGKKEEKVEEEAKPLMKLVTRRERIEAEAVTQAGYETSVVGALTSEEFEMALQDRIVMETNDAKNKLEEYVYNTRDAIMNRLVSYAEEDIRANFKKDLDAMEEWLYSDEGESGNKGIFIQKLEGLQAVGEPIITRAREFDLLPESFTRLEKCVEANAQFAGSKEVKYNHISPDDRASVTEECARMGEWLQQHKDALAGASKHAMPPLTVQQVSDKAVELNRFCDGVMNKAKPAPPAPPPKADPKTNPKTDAHSDAKNDKGMPAHTPAPDASGAEGAAGTAEAADDVPMEGAEEGGGEGKVEGEGGEDDDGGETMDTFGGPAPPGWGK
eukprot:CAMPEP_0179428870 /NCGR_PEP_ID=MMETSP0799-20121207/14419_1 /TAXON_ID=46947 /ORGANISM="Geminigera cryophila, Strain CCMP2564" /LENGTH=892 /DNA_ID=CAMNT_0021204551 /DNA_START=255 /DNA_END=2933 /DNA_ORIENTATION=+